MYKVTYGRTNVYGRALPEHALLIKAASREEAFIAAYAALTAKGRSVNTHRPDLCDTRARGGLALDPKPLEAAGIDLWQPGTTLVVSIEPYAVVVPAGAEVLA
jgi:hypothetical protein